MYQSQFLTSIFWTGQVEILCPWEKLLDPPLFFCSILYAPVSENGFYGKNDSCSYTSPPQYHFVLPFTPMSSQSIDDVGTFCTLFITYTLATVWLIYYGIFESNFIDTYYKSILDKMSQMSGIILIKYWEAYDYDT